jgi:hypothetical protein
LFHNLLLQSEEFNEPVQGHDQPFVNLDHRLAVLTFQMRLYRHQIQPDQIAGGMDGADPVGIN